MTLNEKEITYLKDYQKQEQTCVEKYTKSAMAACSPGLKNMLNQIADEERTHHNTVTELLQGTIPNVNQGNSNKYDEDSFMNTYTYNETDKKNDAFICKDCIDTEKCVSTAYNTGIFEFKDTQMRDVLNHIQKEEQHHGDMLSKYMTHNGMC